MTDLTDTQATILAQLQDGDVMRTDLDADENNYQLLLYRRLLWEQNGIVRLGMRGEQALREYVKANQPQRWGFDWQLALRVGLILIGLSSLVMLISMASQECSHCAGRNPGREAASRDGIPLAGSTAR